ncbi:hypothetical protein LOAG_04935 [Loa loa]|uniref:Uncharacterized protein n=1 Tax=Loa loa TaxID=7209 RepID=A0A1S0U2R4_LOALO|nr:hypothetical protein LOAG_04935 [Loa loa]EFO23549.1 hypothetical protein LOAG_04935 [Loa loa]
MRIHIHTYMYTQIESPPIVYVCLDCEHRGADTAFVGRAPFSAFSDHAFACSPSSPYYFVTLFHLSSTIIIAILGQALAWPGLVEFIPGGLEIKGLGPCSRSVSTFEFGYETKVVL